MQPLLLNVDWLALSVRFRVHDFKPIGGEHYFIDYTGTNVWRKRRIYYNQYGEKIATLLYEPISSIIDQRSGLLEVANQWLYSGCSPKKIIEQIRAARPFDIVGMSRCDLCIDYNPTDYQRIVAEQLASGDCYVGGKRNGSSFWSVVNSKFLADIYQGRTICHCQSWGHKTTGVKWKLYYKSKELADDMGNKAMAKPYILDCWREAGLDKRDVWRLEVSMKHCNQLYYRGEPISFDVMCKHPIELYKALYTERFSIRRAEGHADRSNDEVVEFLPVGKNSGIRVAPPHGTTKRNGRITLLRHLVQSLEAEEVLLHDDSREDVLQHAVNIVERDELQEYFRAMTGDDVYSWVELMRIKADEAKQDHTLPERETLWDIMTRGRTFKDDTNVP